MHSTSLETIPSLERVLPCRGRKGNAKVRHLEIARPAERHAVLDSARTSAAPVARVEPTEARLIVLERGVSLFDAVSVESGGRATVIVARQAAEAVEELIQRIRQRRQELRQAGHIITRADIFLASGHDEIWEDCRELLMALLNFPSELAVHAPLEIAVNACVRAGKRRAARLFAFVETLLGGLNGRVTVRLHFEQP